MFDTNPIELNDSIIKFYDARNSDSVTELRVHPINHKQEMNSYL